MEKATLIGLPLAMGSIIACLILEGGTIRSVLGGPAAMIVLGGALGACFMHFPFEVAMGGLKAGIQCFKPDHMDYEHLIKQITELAGTARKDGLLALEKERGNIEDPLLREAVKYAVDGLDPTLVSQILEARIDHKMHLKGLYSKFWTQMGAYAPTVAIVGAVLGLIIVMQNLDNPEMIGPGIAVAFIATVYGVTSSNVFFLPMGGKIGVLNEEQALYYEMIKVGVRDIQMGTSPSIISSRLLAMLDQDPKEDEA
jgi:chemotaxis protein MotA